MKIRFIAVVLILVVASWAQNATNPTESQDKPAATETKDAMSCCHHMKDSAGKGMSCCHQDAKPGNKEGMSCCKHDAKDASCCAGKGGKAACMKNGDKDKGSASSSADSSCCKGAESCCGNAKDSKDASMGCCRGDKCARHSHSSGM